VCFAGLIASSNLVAWFGVVFAALALAGWHFPLSLSEPVVMPDARPSGWWGMVLLIATEATLFAVLIATYYYLQFEAPRSWPPPGIGDPSMLKPFLATALIAASSIPIAIAVRAAGRSQLRTTSVALLLAALFGVAFLIFQHALVDSSLGSFGPRDNAYGSIYYTLIGLHAVHVAIGILLATWGALRVTRFDRAAAVTVRVTGLYWHFVNVVAVLIFLVLYVSPRG
jgi:heme/copper-type cytochrome/quinol oxidase subunit 3